MAAGFVMVQATPAKVGIIGLGLRSRVHVDAVAKLPDAKVVALSDIESERMAKVNDRLAEKAETYTDYRELIRDKNVGIVVIATPPYLHHEMALAALRAGKDVLLEKPMAINYAQAMEIQREARRTGRIVAVGMQRRYWRADAEYLQVMESGAIGPVRLILYSEFRGDWHRDTSLYTDPATGRKISWRFLKKTAGSTELEFSIHALAHVTNMVKSPLARLAASGGVAHYGGRDTRDVTNIVADFASGARLNYSFTCFAPGVGGGCTVVGDKGTLRREQGKLMLYSGSRKPEPAPIDAARLPEGDPEVLMWKDFLRNVRERTPSPLGPEVALEPSKIAFGAEISISENRIVTAKDFV